MTGLRLAVGLYPKPLPQPGGLCSIRFGRASECMATFSRPSNRLLALSVTLGNVLPAVFGGLRGRFRRKRPRGCRAGGVSAVAGWEAVGLAVVGGGEAVEQ